LEGEEFTEQILIEADGRLFALHGMVENKSGQISSQRPDR
jgi:hypothetical protein